MDCIRIKILATRQQLDSKQQRLLFISSDPKKNQKQHMGWRNTVSTLHLITRFTKRQSAPIFKKAEIDLSKGIRNHQQVTEGKLKPL